MVNAAQRLSALRTESLFRELNDQLAGVYTDRGGGADYVCECGDVACTTAIRVGRNVYDAVRGHPTRFVLADGHQVDGVERVVATTAGFTVVQKPIAL